MHCCCTESYDEFFDYEKAEKDLQDYLKTGIKKNSRPLFALLKDLPLKNRTLLDIGGGVGAIVFELFKKGISGATHNDLSQAYVDTFRKEVKRLHLEDCINSITGDFNEVYARLLPADIVTLDKVICCYSDFRTLVDRSVSKAKRWYVYSIPRDVWWVKIVMWLDYNWMKYKMGKDFITYIHPTSEIEKLLKKAGFRKSRQILQREWVAVLFEKEEKVVRNGENQRT